MNKKTNYKLKDRVKVVTIGLLDVDCLQKDNRIGTIKGIIESSSHVNFYFLKMDKPVVCDDCWNAKRIKKFNIPNGYCYVATENGLKPV